MPHNNALYVVWGPSPEEWQSMMEEPAANTPWVVCKQGPNQHGYGFIINLANVHAVALPADGGWCFSAIGSPCPSDDHFPAFSTIGTYKPQAFRPTGLLVPTPPALAFIDPSQFVAANGLI